MMGVFAVVRIQPFTLFLAPGNAIVAIALLVGAGALLVARRFSLAIPTAAALVTMVGGLLSFAKVSGFELPGYPLIWLVVGLYIEMRLVLIHQNLRRQTLDQKGTDGDQPKDPGNGPRNASRGEKRDPQDGPDRGDAPGPA